MNEMTVRRLRSLADWLSASDAGQALWHISFGYQGMEPPSGAKPAKSVRIAMPSEDIDIDGDIDKLREQLKDYY